MLYPYLYYALLSVSALTAYSPSVIALNEMLRQQIKLTENFIAIQQHLNQNLIQHAQPDYSYTTLQDTKRVRERSHIIYEILSKFVFPTRLPPFPFSF